MSREIRRSYEFDSFRLDPVERQLLRDGAPVPLTPKVFETLVVLVERSGHLVEKEELMKLVWADAFVEEANLARCVHTLRKALGEEHGEHKYIETVPKRGYRFNGEVRVSEQAIADAPIKTLAVLPFKSLVAENREEALEVGMADTLISRLGNNREIVVRPISSVRKYSGLEQDAVQAGRALAADSVLDGSIQRWGENIRVNVRLVKTGGRHFALDGNF